MTDGAHTVALHLLRSRASADLERQVESELVIRLLEGTADAATSLAGWACRTVGCGSSRCKPSSAANAMPLCCWHSSVRPPGSAGRDRVEALWWAAPSTRCFRATSRRRRVAGLQVCGLRCLNGRQCGPVSAQGRKCPTSPPPATRPTSVWRCTRRRPGPRPLFTTSRGTTSCYSGCGPLHGQVVPQTVAPSPSCAATTMPTRPTT